MSYLDAASIDVVRVIEVVHEDDCVCFFLQQTETLNVLRMDIASKWVYTQPNETFNEAVRRLEKTVVELVHIFARDLERRREREREPMGREIQR